MNLFASLFRSSSRTDLRAHAALARQVVKDDDGNTCRAPDSDAIMERYWKNPANRSIMVGGRPFELLPPEPRRAGATEYWELVRRVAKPNSEAVRYAEQELARLRKK